MQLSEEKIKNKKLNEENQDLKNKYNDQTDELNKLKEIIIQKDKEIHELKIKSKENLSIDDIMVINFISTDQKVRYAIKCLPNDIFSEVEGKLYQAFPEYRITNNLFLLNGKQILRFKTIKENNIHDADTIQLILDQKK
jgi:hypothetical protein